MAQTRNFKFHIAYDGTRYYGWEHQPDRPTVQGKLEEVLSRMTDAPVEVVGAGRTDAGVHAKDMVANAHLQTDETPEQIRAYMNRYLPEDVCVLEVREASPRFHARYNALGKTYRYTCYIGDTKPVFDRKFVLTLPELPDTEKMRQAAEILEGEHDFRSFCSNPQMKKSTVRRVDSIQIVQKKDYLYFTFHGTGFLQNMVRILVGTLLEVGQGKLRAEQVAQILEAKDRRLAGYTVPPQGLCLLKVDY